jgi:hypothetical protein
VKPTVVTLCGSTRFPEAFIEATKKETLEGKIVISVGLFGHQEGIDMGGPTKAMLDQLHFRKIDISDEILVLNVRTDVCETCGKPANITWHGILRMINPCIDCKHSNYATRPYIGSSTRNEIEYATKNGKKVRYLNELE